MSATATPPPRWPPVFRPRWSASASATPISPSPWTSTATSFPAWTRRPPTPWPASSSTVPAQQNGPDQSPGPPLTNDRHRPVRLSVCEGGEAPNVLVNLGGGGGI